MYQMTKKKASVPLKRQRPDLCGTTLVARKGTSPDRLQTCNGVSRAGLLSFSRPLRGDFPASSLSAFHQTAALCAGGQRYFSSSQRLRIFTRPFYPFFPPLSRGGGQPSPGVSPFFLSAGAGGASYHKLKKMSSAGYAVLSVIFRTGGEAEMKLKSLYILPSGQDVNTGENLFFTVFFNYDKKQQLNPIFYFPSVRTRKC